MRRQPPLPVQDRVPFQYLIASAHWREHVLAVGPGVLIPRPETEVFAGVCVCWAAQETEVFAGVCVLGCPRD